MRTGPPPAHARVREWLRPWRTWLRHGGYFRWGLERGVCRRLHRAAARGTLYRFAPPPPLRLVARGCGRWGADEYRFRSAFVSDVPARDEARLRHYRVDARAPAPPLDHGGRRERPLVILNHAAAAFARGERYLIGPLLAGGLDVVLPIAPGFQRRRCARDWRGGWAATVGGALAAIVQLVHDTVAIEAWARRVGYRTVVVAGLGLGGTVAAVLAATTARFDAYVTALAGAHPGRLWLPPRPLARAVHRPALARAGVRHARTLARLFDPVAPNRLPPPRAPGRCTVVGLRFDTLVPPADVRDLAAHWRVVPRWLPACRVELPAYAEALAAIVAAVGRQAAGDGAAPRPALGTGT